MFHSPCTLASRCEITVESDDQARQKIYGYVQSKIIRFWYNEMTYNIKGIPLDNEYAMNNFTLLINRASLHPTKGRYNRNMKTYYNVHTK